MLKSMVYLKRTKINLLTFGLEIEGIFLFGDSVVVRGTMFNVVLPFECDDALFVVVEKYYRFLRFYWILFLVFWLLACELVFFLLYSLRILL